MAYALAGGRKKRSAMIYQDDLSAAKHVIQGIKDFAKVITTHVPDVEKQTKKLLNKPKLKTTELLQAINNLEQKAYENMFKKRLNSQLNFDILLQSINNPLMWGLSDILDTLNIESIMMLLNKLKPQIPESFAKYNIMQLYQ